MDLACKENFSQVKYANLDNNIYKDERVIKNLLREERFYMPNCYYFESVQTDIQPFMRKVVTTWMLEVCEEQMCEDQVLPLAVNYMDRFLCICNIKRQQLQLLGATCLLIASKIRSSNSLPIDLLCAYTDYSVTYELMVNWELLVLSKLKWNVASVTGFDYIDHIIARCSWGNESSLLRRHAHTLVSICYTEPTLILSAPSEIAAACICSAIRGLKLMCSEIATQDLCRMIGIDRITLEAFIRVVEDVIEKVEPPKTPIKEDNAIKPFYSPTYSQPETPTEVDKIDF